RTEAARDARPLFISATVSAARSVRSVARSGRILVRILLVEPGRSTTFTTPSPGSWPSRERFVAEDGGEERAPGEAGTDGEQPDEERRRGVDELRADDARDESEADQDVVEMHCIKRTRPAGRTSAHRGIRA